MNRLCYCFFSFVFLIPAIVQPQSIDRSVVDRIKNAIVYIDQKRSIPTSKQNFSFSGTGFFISSSGHVVTNYHVIQKAIAMGPISFPMPIVEMRLVMNSGSPAYHILRGRIIAIDKENDLAVFETDTSQVPFLTVGNEKGLVETTPVWAFGYPLGDAFALIQRGPEISVTRGTVSALRHNDRGVLTAVQIDAAINPGNSGGPLVDQKGTVVGIVNRAGGTTGLNFAVPSHFLSTLCRKLPPHQGSGDSCSIDIASVPSKASFFIDNKYRGETPLARLIVERNAHSFLIVKNGFESWIADTVITSNWKCDVALKAVAPFPLNVTEASDEKREGESTLRLSSSPLQKIIFKCDFNDTGQFAQWQQETGGSSARTWFVEKGLLHQHESDEMLHAIYCGDTNWNNYILTAKVRINDSHNDSRAGLIFRENPDGFYLFRIHRESTMAQLTYHSRHPFGWFVLAKKKINTPVGDSWHDMTVSVAGTTIACFLDESCIFRTSATYSAHGRIGFYSVESKASFDSCTVHQALQTGIEGVLLSPPGLVSFWFTDLFDLSSTWWRHYSPAASFTQPWCYSEGGSVQQLHDGKPIISECTRYQLKNFRLELILTIGDSGTDSRIGFLFRKKGDQYCIVEVSKSDSKIRLLHEDKGKRKKLKEEKMDESIFGETSRFDLVVNEHLVDFYVNDSKVISCKKGAIPTTEGTIGFMTAGVATVFHKLTISSSVERQ